MRGSRLLCRASCGAHCRLHSPLPPPPLHLARLPRSLQDYHNFPKVDRSITQLQQYAESLRARTNKFRTLDNQIAATRLLAQQGFDASRWARGVAWQHALGGAAGTGHGGRPRARTAAAACCCSSAACGVRMRRLTQEVTSLEIQPTIEDVFHADTTSVEEYLKQVEESTILAALQVRAHAGSSAHGLRIASGSAALRA